MCVCVRERERERKRERERERERELLLLFSSLLSHSSSSSFFSFLPVSVSHLGIIHFLLVISHGFFKQGTRISEILRERFLLNANFLLVNLNITVVMRKKRMKTNKRTNKERWRAKASHDNQRSSQQEFYSRNSSCSIWTWWWRRGQEWWEEQTTMQYERLRVTCLFLQHPRWKDRLRCNHIRRALGWIYSKSQN